MLGESALGTGAFVVVFGLDWVATVPPTVALTVEAFGRERAGVVFGWIFAAHQLGAALGRLGGGRGPGGVGAYTVAFMGAGLLGVAAAFMTLGIASRGRPAREAAALPM